MHRIEHMIQTNTIDTFSCHYRLYFYGGVSARAFQTFSIRTFLSCLVFSCLVFSFLSCLSCLVFFVFVYFFPTFILFFTLFLRVVS